jgi:ribosomal protein S18 acetylase RimI-like enzyme
MPPHAPSPVEVIPLDLAEPGLPAELVRLQRAAYAVEAALIGDDRIPPLHEDAEQLRAAGLQWLGVPGPHRAAFRRRSPALAAAVAWVVEDGVLDLHRLVVDPSCARRGLGRALVQHLLDAHPDGPAVVSTGRGNAPARRLYEGLGFSEVGTVEVLPGLQVVRYELAR